MNNSALQVFKGGWEELQNATLTDNLSLLSAASKSFFIKPDGDQIFVIAGGVVETFTLSIPWDPNSLGSVIRTFTIDEDTTPFGIFFQDDGTKMFVVGQNSERLFEYTLSIPWDTDSIINPSFSVFAQDASPTGIAFSNNGLRMFVVGAAGDTINQYLVNVPFDITKGVTFQGSFSVTAQDTNPTGIAFSDTGDKMFIVGSTGDSVYQYSLTLPFIITSGVTFQGSFSVATEDTGPQGIDFSTDGLTMFVLGNITNNVYQYTLTTAFDITSGVSLAGSTPIGAQDAGGRGLCFSTDGLTMFFVGNVGDSIYQYSLTTAFVITSGVTFIGSFSVAAQETTPYSVAFSTDGLTMFLMGAGTRIVYQYSLTTPFDITSGVAYLIPELDLSGLTNPPKQCAFSQTGDIVFVTDGDEVRRFPLTTPWDITTSGLSTSFLPGGFVDSIAFKSEGDKMYLGEVTTDIITEYDLPTPFAFGGITVVDTLDLSGIPANPSSIFWRSTGNQFFVLDSGVNNIRRLESIRIQWDISVLSYFENIIDTGGPNPRDLFWKPDGAKFYVIDATLDNIREFITVTPWNMTGATLNFTFSVSGQENQPQALFFRFDGKKMYVGGQNITDMFEYNLSTAWDLSTAVVGNQFNPDGNANVHSIFWKPDGLVLFLQTNNDDVKQYAVGTSFDLLTINPTPVAIFSFSTEGSDPRGMFFSTDGKNLYSSDANANMISRYVLSVPFDVSLANAPVLADQLDVSVISPSIQGLFIRQDDGKKLFLISSNTDDIVSLDMSLEFNKNLITELGEDLVTDAGENLVYA